MAKRKPAPPMRKEASPAGIVCPIMPLSVFVAQFVEHFEELPADATHIFYSFSDDGREIIRITCKENPDRHERLKIADVPEHLETLDVGYQLIDGYIDQEWIGAPDPIAALENLCRNHMALNDQSSDLDRKQREISAGLAGVEKEIIALMRRDFTPSNAAYAERIHAIADKIAEQ